MCKAAYSRDRVKITGGAKMNDFTKILNLNDLPSAAKIDGVVTGGQYHLNTFQQIVLRSMQQGQVIYCDIEAHVHNSGLTTSALGQISIIGNTPDHSKLSREFKNSVMADQIIPLHPAFDLEYVLDNLEHKSFSQVKDSDPYYVKKMNMSEVRTGKPKRDRKTNRAKKLARKKNRG